MAIYISRKYALTRFLICFLISGILAAEACYLLQGPVLGKTYDFFSRGRSDVLPDPSLLLLDTAVYGDDGKAGEEGLPHGLVEPRTAVMVMLALTEFGSRGLLIEAPVLDFSAPTSSSQESLEKQFTEEFDLVDQNTRSLFEAIRQGSIQSREAPRFLEDLITLNKQGRERLLRSFVRRDEEGRRLLQRSSAILGNTFWEGDGTATYFRPQNDEDHVLRRIAPVLVSGGEGSRLYSGYRALISLYGEGEIIETKHGMALAFTRQGENPQILPLDTRGALLIERKLDSLPSLPISRIEALQRSEAKLLSALREAEKQGCFEPLNPEERPPFLYDHSRELETMMLSSSSPASSPQVLRDEWLSSRKLFLDAAVKSLNGEVLSQVEEGFEDLLQAEDFQEGQRKKILSQREEIGRSHQEALQALTAYLGEREALSKALQDRYCILGSRTFRSNSPGGFQGSLLSPWENSPAETAALFMSALLSGRVIRSLPWPYSLASSCLILLLLSLALMKAGPLPTLCAGLGTSTLVLLGLNSAFVIAGIWVDPWIPLPALLLETGLSCLLAWRGKRRHSRAFRVAYGERVGKPILREIVKQGRPGLEETLTVYAALAAARFPSLYARENVENPAVSAANLMKFREEACAFFKEGGAVVVSCEGDLVIAAFGSPPELAARHLLPKKKAGEGDGEGAQPLAVDRGGPSAAQRAVKLILEGASSGGSSGRWCFGVDAGLCAFTYSRLGGYSAAGGAVVRSRLLSQLAPRYKARVLVTETVTGQMEARIGNSPKANLLRKLDSLKTQDMKESFYQLITINEASESMN